MPPVGAPPKPSQAAKRPAPVKAPAPAPSAVPAAKPGAPAKPAVPPAIEADVRLRIVASGNAAANGTVKVDAGFMTRLIKHLLRNPRRFGAIAVHFEPATGAYAVDGKVKLFGIWLPASGKARIVADQGLPAVVLDDVRLRLGGGKGFTAGWIRKLVTEALADELAKDGLKSSAEPTKGLVRLEPTALLHEIKALPGWAGLETPATRFGVTTAPNGDVTVSMQADAQGPALRDTPLSDLSIGADAAGLRALLARALAPGFEVRDLALVPGGMTVSGAAEARAISEVVNGLAGVLAIVARSQGIAANPGRTDVMLPLDLAATADGTKLTVKPSLRPAVRELVKTLQQANIPHTATRDAVQIDLAAWLATKGLDTRAFSLGPNGLSANLAIDIDARLKNPALKRPGSPTS